MKKLTMIIPIAFLSIITITFLPSCTVSMTMVHTEGMASDVVDETDTVSPDVSPNLTIPASVF